MKKIILTILMIFLPLIVHAAVYEVTTPGNNVGLGTSTPGEQLDVNGTIRGTNLISIGNGQSTFNSNVGIGTTLTTNLLDVAGGVAIGTTNAGYNTAPANGLIVQGLTGIGNTSPGQALDVTGTVRSTSFIQTGSVANNFTGNVGIGSSNPGAALDISDNIQKIINITSTSANAYMQFTGGGTTDGNGGIKLINSTGQQYNFGVQGHTNGTANDGFTLYNGSSGKFTFLIDSGGNFGIGTSAPLSELSVGNLSGQQGSTLHTYSAADEGLFNYYFDQNYPTSNQYFRILDIVSTGASGVRSAIRFMNQITAGAAPVQTMGIDYNGNVGIGSVNPGGIMDVEGTTTPIIFAGNSANLNVGVGSVNPGQRLDVVGTIRALSAGTCTTLYKCQGGTDAGVIQTVACGLCPTSSCVAMNGCF